MTEQSAPVGAVPIDHREPLDAFAFETLHGAMLVGDLLDKAMCSATPRLRQLYPDLARAIGVAEEALCDLYHHAGLAWDSECKLKEGKP